MTTKQYLRFSSGEVLGVIGSATAKIIPLDPPGKTKVRNNLFAVPACENVYIWNLRSKEKSLILNGGTSTVTCLISNTGHNSITVGYEDGSIQVFDLRTGESLVSFIGHKTAVSCLAFEENGSNLASGGKDTEIVIWNLTDETGLYRLKGHKGPVTQCRFYKPQNILISSSKDTFIKFWDLDTQHCFYTLVGCRFEVLDFALIKGTHLIAGLNSQHLKMWDISFSAQEDTRESEAKKLKVEPSLNEDLNNVEDDDSETDRVKVSCLGEISINDRRCNAIVVDPDERLMGIHGSSKFIYLYKILTEEEIAKKLRKRKRKEMKRKQGEMDETEMECSLKAEDNFHLLNSIRLGVKVDSFKLSLQDSLAKVTALLKNNSIAEYEIDLSSLDSEVSLRRNIEFQGHPSVIRTLAFSQEGFSILSACEERLKIWKSPKEEYKCTANIECESALCSIFVTGNKYCIIGTKKGLLNIFDIDTSEVVESISAHEGSVKCICSSPKQSGITSGGTDKEVKFWDFELRNQEETSTKKTLSLCLRRKLEMPEEILCLKYSPDGKRLAIALLDYTVQVLFSDSLKLVFSLYGHELPVTCLDISHDSTLIVTGSLDRTIRIWSMEFGSCNRRIRIPVEKVQNRDRGITCLQFLPKTHLFFTGGKDHIVRQWDADKFHKVISLKGHQDEITAMAVSPDGSCVVTSSKDRSIRLWEKTTEPLILEEEQENELEEKEQEVEDLPEIPGETNKEVALSGMKTVETIKTVDQLIEALDLYAAETQKLEEYEMECKAAGKKLPPPAPHPLFLALRITSPLEYIRKALKKIKASELEGSLLHLPFNYVLDFFRVISELVDKGWETEFCEKCTTFLVRVYFGQLSTSRAFRPILEKLKDKLFQDMYHVKDMVGFAKVVSGLHQKAIESREEVSFFSTILDDKKKRKKRVKKKAVLVLK